VPMLGVCLGMQAIVEHFGGRLRNLAAPLHGVARQIEVVGDCPVLGGEADEVGHYHSWVADENTWPDVLEVTARERQGEKNGKNGKSENEDMILAMRHRSLPVYGVQFHPESVLTPGGRAMLGRWLAAVEKVQAKSA
ncbi:MAG: aminodeoxychorismate/anthranilate synthase component II, partial [Flavobacteriales bacterium]|nr:aminodeoxychorismate/anthranilate synthase component II [Flavobacteriales bacterium]